MKTLGSFDWIDGSWSLDKSRLLKYEKFVNPDLDSKIWNRSGAGV